MLEKIFENAELTDKAKTAITEAFEATVSERANERVALEVENAIKDVDAAHGKMLKKLMESLDRDHAKKFRKALAHIDHDHANKFRKIAEHYKGIITKDAASFRAELTDNVSDYMDLYLEKTIPEATIRKAVENTSAKRLLESIKKIVSVDEEYIDNNIREALTDGKNIIDDLRSQLNQSLKENVDINKELSITSGTLMLEKKLNAMPADKKVYIERLLKGKTPEYIEENFNYVVEMFERSDDDDNEVIVEQAKSKIVTEKIDTPVVSESVKVSSVDAPVSGYLSELKAQDSR